MFGCQRLHRPVDRVIKALRHGGDCSRQRRLRFVRGYADRNERNAGPTGGGDPGGQRFRDDRVSDDHVHMLADQLAQLTRLLLRVRRRIQSDERAAELLDLCLGCFLHGEQEGLPAVGVQESDLERRAGFDRRLAQRGGDGRGGRDAGGVRPRRARVSRIKNTDTVVGVDRPIGLSCSGQDLIVVRRLYRDCIHCQRRLVVK